MLPAAKFAQYVVVTNVCGFLAVALLAGSVAERLRSTGAQLVDTSAAMEDLRTFNAHVINSLVSGLATADAGWRVLSFNRAATAITGVPADRAIGADVRDVLALPPAFREQLGRPGDSQGPARATLPYATADGRTIDLGVTAAPLLFPGWPPGHLFTFQDVTDVKRLERDAGRRERLAAVGEMAAGIAHEIRNPLASMSGSMQVLRSELALNGDQAELMDIVLKESERLNQTIRSFLAYARPPRPTLGRADLGRIVTDTARLLQNGADVRPGHRIDVQVPPGPVWYRTDEDQVRQIVWNLASNGLRAMPDGGRLSLSVAESSAERRRIEIVVEDEGCGIAADELDRIFQPFHSTFERGTGLGLATVHRLVGELRGTIQVTSTRGRGHRRCGCGCRCDLYEPAAAARARGSRMSAGTVDRGAAPDRHGGRGARRHACSWWTTRRRCATCCASCCAATATRCWWPTARVPHSRSWSGRPSICCSPTSGCRTAAAWTSLRAAKDANRDVVAFMMTAFASTDTAVEAMRLGAVDYFTKPFNVDELRLKIAPAPRDAPNQGRERRPEARAERDARVLEPGGPQPGDAGALPADRDRGQDAQHGAHHRRVRHRQGDGGQGHPRQLAPPGPPVRGAELRRRAGDAARVGALRARARRVHGRRHQQEGAGGGRRGRHHLPRRDRGDDPDACR